MSDGSTVRGIPAAYLTKSKILSGLQCRKKLWLFEREPGRAAPVHPALARHAGEGIAVGELARTAFENGTLVECSSNLPADVAALTRDYIDRGVSTLFEAGFCAEVDFQTEAEFHLDSGIHATEVFVRVDVLHRENSGYRIIEVKSSTRVKHEHLADVAVQRFVCELSGLEIRQAEVMHLASGASWPDADSLFVTEDVTDKTSEWLSDLPETIGELSRVLAGSTPPEVSIGTHCTNPVDCAFKAFCWRNVPKPSIFNIRGLPGEMRDAFAGRGLLSPADLGREELPAEAKRYIELYARSAPEVDWSGIETMFDRLEPPLYFLDFETDNPAIPRFPGTSPYEQVPFQYSLHVLESVESLADPTAAVRHTEYLHRDAGDPRECLAEKLVDDLGGKGSIIAYWAVFEKRVISRLSTTLPELRTRLKSLGGRFWDLFEVFKRHYAHPGFLGSFSLKKVLPVLVPALSYDTLDVGDGVAAQIAWNRMLVTDDKGETARLEAALLEYCRRDTYAMVALCEVLYRWLAGRASRKESGA